MCATCGCAGEGAVLHGHGHGDGHSHPRPIARDDSRTILLQQRVLAKNDGIAGQNREWLARRGVTMLNLMARRAQERPL